MIITIAQCANQSQQGFRCFFEISPLEMNALHGEDSNPQNGSKVFFLRVLRVFRSSAAVQKTLFCANYCLTCARDFGRTSVLEPQTTSAPSASHFGPKVWGNLADLTPLCGRWGSYSIASERKATFGEDCEDIQKDC